MFVFECFSPAGIGGFSLPRASLLQRAEAGEGLTPDDAVRTSGGVSAGGHDLRDPSRHTWRRDADPSHADDIRSAQRETLRLVQKNPKKNASQGRLTLSRGGGLTGDHATTT